MILVINPYGEFPFNDDWLYAQSVKALVETGKFYMAPLTSVNLFVQIGWGALFCLPCGFSFTALRVSTLVAGAFGLWGTYRLINTSTNNQQTAFIGTLLTMVNPIYLGLSASFMTDVPFYALMVWSLSYLVAGLKQDVTRFILIGLGLAVIALLIRQLGIAIFMGFGLAYLVRKGIHRRSILVAGISVGSGLCVQIAYQKWMKYMMTDMVMYNAQAGNLFHLSYYRMQLLSSFINNMFVCLMYVGLFMFPYFLLLLTRQSKATFIQDRWLWLLIVGIVIALWQVSFHGMNMPIWFNVLNAFGIGPILLKDLYYRIYSLPFPTLLHIITMLMTGMSLLGSAYILYHLVRLVPFLLGRSISLSQRAIVILLSSFLVIYFFPIGMQVLFDRYLLPIPVLLLILIHWLQPVPEQKPLEHTLPLPLYLSVGLGIGYLIFSVCATHDYLAWNRVRWESLNNLMKQGVKPAKIDGGHEFNGWYLYSSSYKSSPTKSWWWVHDDTYVVGASLMPGYALYQKHDVDTWLPWGIQQIIINKKSQSGDVTQLTNPYSTN
ncbi:glycosyltransferase family 39 protein [Spirosoma validum]|uniref:Glycosyltransferase family 39 protein n=1 Tax=Spirosoma validum TaxID=2771355 RepID=A0A927AXT8_9BACT|nr:glycosyltransferase family 39 protein [Spirosoma validum]MBD2751790.1 glycosyltransferase family 39 protein [Spirosoma validum]